LICKFILLILPLFILSSSSGSSLFHHLDYVLHVVSDTAYFMIQLISPFSHHDFYGKFSSSSLGFTKRCLFISIVGHSSFSIFHRYLAYIFFIPLNIPSLCLILHSTFIILCKFKQKLFMTNPFKAFKFRRLYDLTLFNNAIILLVSCFCKVF